MCRSFQQSFFIKGQLRNVFFEPEPPGNAKFYYVRIADFPEEEMMTIARDELGRWSLSEDSQQKQFTRYGQLFIKAIIVHISNNLS